MSNIFVIHCILYKNDNIISRYNLGWYKNLKNAEFVLENNIGEIFCDLCNYAAIEMVNEGLREDPAIKIAWFEPVFNNGVCNKAKRINEPEQFKELINLYI